MLFNNDKPDRFEFASCDIDLNSNGIYASLYTQYSEITSHENQKGSLKEAAYAAGSCAEAARRIGLLDKSQLSYMFAIKAFQLNKDYSGLAWAKWGFANLLRQKGEYSESSKLICEAYIIAKLLRNKRLTAYCMAGYAENTRIQGNYNSSIKLHYFTYRLFKNIGDIRGMSWALQGIGQMLRISGKCSSSFRFFNQSSSLSKHIGDLRGHAFSLKGMGENLSFLGFNDRATLLLQAAINEFSKIGYMTGVGYSYMSLARHEIRYNNYDIALKMIHTAESFFHDSNDRRGLAYLGCIKGDIARLDMKKNEAFHFYAQSIKDFREMGIGLGNILACRKQKTLVKE